MKSVLRSIIGIVVLVIVVYGVSNYYGLIQEKVGVKGASTSKAQEVSDSIKSDLGKEAQTATDNASGITVGQIIGFFGRFQKIPQDLSSSKDFIQSQINAYTKK